MLIAQGHKYLMFVLANDSVNSCFDYSDGDLIERYAEKTKLIPS